MKNALSSKKQSVIILVLIINTFLFSSVFGTALSGTYTIGGSPDARNYVTISDAVTALTANGVS
ncbi:MAG: hypothetical protein A3K10_02525 [Bacteroidetes bacterium RIFCSPLOWO2_12_FULL_31_6]|nr:MAG: hypothetical protein A3K10_02525 [Bacteroidetes bacterium RIFCSPLOWO2_12_FULL_31_6]